MIADKSLRKKRRLAAPLLFQAGRVSDGNARIGLIAHADLNSPIGQGLHEDSLHHDGRTKSDGSQHALSPNKHDVSYLTQFAKNRPIFSQITTNLAKSVSAAHLPLAWDSRATDSRGPILTFALRGLLVFLPIFGRRKAA